MGIGPELLPDAPAIEHTKAHQELFSSAAHILSELASDGEVQMTHDTEWDQFPIVAQALKTAGFEDNCYIVAKCPSKGVWGVGIAASWKHRETSGKIALS